MLPNVQRKTPANPMQFGGQGQDQMGVNPRQPGGQEQDQIYQPPPPPVMEGFPPLPQPPLSGLVQAQQTLPDVAKQLEPDSLMELLLGPENKPEPKVNMRPPGGGGGY